MTPQQVHAEYKRKQHAAIAALKQRYARTPGTFHEMASWLAVAIHEADTAYEKYEAVCEFIREFKLEVE